MNNQNLILSLGMLESMLGLEIKLIVHMIVNGKLKLIILLPEMLQHGLLYLRKNQNGDQFSMSQSNKHHQDIQPCLS